MRREFSKGFVRLADRNRTESEADDAQVRRFKQILLDEGDLQELSRLPADDRRGPPGGGVGPPLSPAGGGPPPPGASRPGRRAGGECGGRRGGGPPAGRQAG